jgi:tRNA A-37 threonylcarbamoyl transferase component Bud32
VAGHRSPVSASEITRVLGGAVRLPSRYADPELIARGGMSEVYRATDTVLDRPVAIKVLHEQYADDGEFLQRFSREALAAGRLSGEAHTVTIYDVAAWDGRPTIVMELLEGGSLDDVLRATGAQPPERALRWLDHAAAALDHAHAHGVVHRDVKPANLLLDGDSTLHVADFGIATALGSVSLTRTGTVLGTVGYLAPEQAEGKPASPASDRYALAVVAYELLTGTRPFARDSAMAEAAAHVTEPVPSATSRRPRLPPAVASVLERGLAKDPAARYASCRAFVDALRYAFAPAAPTRVAVAPVPARRRRRRVAVLAGVAAVVAAAAAFAAAQLLDHNTKSGKAAPPPPRHAATHTVAARPPAARQPAPVQPDPFAPQARALIALAAAAIRFGRCDGVLPLLDRAQSLGGDPTQIDALRSACTGPPGHRPGHGHGHGHGHGPGLGLGAQGDQG